MNVVLHFQFDFNFFLPTLLSISTPTFLSGQFSKSVISNDYFIVFLNLCVIV